MAKDNQENTGFSDALGEHDYSTKFTLVGRSQSKYVENPGIASGNIECIEVATMSIPGAIADLGTDAANKAMGGFDTIFSPYTTASGHSELPHFGIPTNLTEPNAYTLDPFNPNDIFSTGNSQAVNNAIYTASGHNIQIANTWTAGDIAGSTSGDVFFAKDLHNHGEFTFDGVKSIGLRAPIVLTGWGFDVSNRPVPADTGDSTAFASDAFRNPNIWKSGPLDVRWDDERKVWTAASTKIYLVKTTNAYNPSCFSYEVQRSTSRAQYTRDTLSSKAFSATDAIHDPEYLAYTADPNNAGCFERLDFDSQEYPHYEAFIIRETNDETDSNPYYNIWTDDCHDCGHITNSGCGTQHGSDSTGKKILIENPLRQSLNVGDLAFTVKTGRKEKVNTGSFTGGTGTGASGNLVTDSGGNMSGDITAAGSAYQYGAFAIITGDICTNVSLAFETASTGLSAITVSPTGGFVADTTYPLSIYPNDATTETEELDIHLILQAEFKSQQVTTHVECDGGILQTCTTQIQTQGFKTCEWCGEDSTLINNTI